MLTFEKCHPKHFEYIAPTTVQLTEFQSLQMPGVAEYFASGIALSAWVSGRCIGAAGVLPRWKGRAEAWTLFSEDAGKYIWPCLAKMKYVLNNLDFKRVDMVVQKGNGSGHLIAKRLGFVIEMPLEAWYDGKDYFMYKRIKR